MYGKREIPAPFASQKQKPEPPKPQGKQKSGCHPAAMLVLLDLLSR